MIQATTTPEPAPVAPFPSANPAPQEVGPVAYVKKIVNANYRRILIWLLTMAAAGAYNHLVGGGDVPLPAPPDFVWPENPFGWLPPTKAEYARTLNNVPLFSETEAGSLTKWKDGDNILLYRLHKAATGKDFGPYQQGPLGCCVSFGSGGAVEMALACQIALQRHGPQAYDTICREAIYGGGRVNIPRQGLPSEGMIGSWAAEWLTKSGAVGTGQGDPKVGPYDVNRCKVWGDRGVPANVVQLGNTNKVSTSLVQSAADVQNALANAYPVFICSSVGFGNLNGPPLQRDKDGFLRQSGSWPHCMFVCGYRGGARKGFLIVNSWGSGWIQGPKGFGDEPEGSFWCDYSVMDLITHGNTFDPPDSYAVSTIGGFKRRKLEVDDWLLMPAPPELRKPDRGGFIGNEVANFGWLGGRR